MDKILPLDMQVDVLYELMYKVIEEGTIKSRIVKFKLQKHIDSHDVNRRLYAANKIISNGKGIDIVPNSTNMSEVLEETSKLLADIVAKRYVQNKIEKDVEQYLIEKQDKYVDEVRLSIIKKQKGPENAKTLRKYAELEILDSKKLTKNIMSMLRPESFSEIIGQERAIKSLISKMASPYPQHIILYGPPGVGKTTAARLALEEAKKLKHTPYNEDVKFVEVDGTTLRWDPREIANPLLGSVHDPIYQGSKRDLAEVGIPEPKPGLVTDAHGGVLFIDEIGELDSILQNKLLKVLEDKRVEFSSSYYDPDDEQTPKYIKYLFDNGAPADFVLIGATTREPSEINPALRSRCTEVYFEPLSPRDIENIVKNAANKLNVNLEENVAKEISRYTIEGRKAVNILADVYGYVLYNNDDSSYRTTITMKALQEVISISRLKPYEEVVLTNDKEIGQIYGLGVAGYLGSTLEIEASVFEAKTKGAGVVRFNETAGSMAKDSVFNAASVIRKITNKDIKDYDIHVNVVGGGNIDGPSAGVAITVCIISALLDKPLRQDIAITGEISLRGKVKPVGGIFEKVYGARRKGIKTVIIPKDNINEVPLGLSDIQVIAVSTIEELLEIVF
ncbi:ATP-dependent protease, Lon family [Clostridium argentinense CDC 2741]|uniref:endopeptidase La n=1 Tax=Clostridium argentinense CDC 2741 TaxID=1418104 RepID=A0A0C1TYM6_9CLOT|nr:Lon family ATP-dependent protease [Clostridium argentinense]ARC86919.1 ATP-dependent protease, Lon family [Clostridium argentinense]KIE45799.1 ATP-dependent protease, Lon family [Clostridium argentinense CDC 2741]NFF39218.1 ATP-dependent protease, Lon family [Clostridium argentinense]NFP49630.1 ATP-dependent protease, Lon family [Clostridium argentinense]NFP72333.1 ATP-dependent protease, Lon family [Clostridium argentinense]